MDFERKPAIDNAAPPYVSYNQYVMLRPGGNNVVDHDDVIPLEDYKVRKAMVLDSRYENAEDGSPLFPGEKEDIDLYEIASKQCKRIMKTMLEALRTNEVLSICFAPFDSSNIVVTITGQVKFRNVEILRNLDAALLLFNQRENYMTALRIFQNLFEGYPPEDIQDLFDMIQHEFYTSREMFHIHGSVMPVEDYSQLYKDLYDYLTCVMDPEDLWDILFMLPYVESWILDISSNVLLTTTFQYNENRRYVVPKNRGAQTCLQKLQKDALKNIRMENIDMEQEQVESKEKIDMEQDQLQSKKNIDMDQDQNIDMEQEQLESKKKKKKKEEKKEDKKKEKKKLTDVDLHLIAAMQFLEYLRNRTSHRMDPFQWYSKLHGIYSAAGTERVVYVRFPRIICYLQRELFRRNRLQFVQPYHIITPVPPAEEPVPNPPAEEPVPNPPAEEFMPEVIYLVQEHAPQPAPVQLYIRLDDD